MTDIFLPLELGTPLVSGWSEQEPNVLLRTNMDQGPAKVRRWGTAGVGAITAMFSWDKPQRDIWKLFFKTTLANGAFSFTMTHPIDKHTITVRLKEIPTETVVTHDRFSYTLTLERMPVEE